MSDAPTFATNPGFLDEAAGGFDDDLFEACERVAEIAEETSAVGATGRYSISWKVAKTGDNEVTVYSDDWKAHWQEWGVEGRPGKHTLRNAARRAGLKVRTT